MKGRVILTLPLFPGSAGGETVLMSKVTQDPATGIVVGSDRHLGPAGGLEGAAGGEVIVGGAAAVKDASSEGVVVGIAPLRGRIFLFPHATPHAGAACVSVPKVMLRAEVAIL